jgi:hypothetical protein
MTKEQLAETLEHKPFKPVMIATTNGDHYQALEERDVHCNSRRRLDRVVVFTEDGLFHLLDAAQNCSTELSPNFPGSIRPLSKRPPEKPLVSKISSISTKD